MVKCHTLNKHVHFYDNFFLVRTEPEPTFHLSSVNNSLVFFYDAKIILFL